MYINAANLIKNNNSELSITVTQWVKTHFPNRTSDFLKCSRDLEYIITALADCVEAGNVKPIEQLSRMFFVKGQLQIRFLHVEFQAYDFLLTEIKKLLVEELDSYNFCITVIETLKHHLRSGNVTNNDNAPRNTKDYETRIKHALYGWDEEREIMRGMQQCQRNWDYSKTVPTDAVNYLLWIAQNAPSKQHEAYYDVHWSTDRETIEYLYQFSWGSTHRKNPPAMWRNSQMNANLYMIFVCKVPDTMYNCNNDGTLQDPFSQSRWDNAIVSVGMAMGLVMRAAHKMGLKTGPNKMVDLGPDYNYEWEKRLGIYEDATQKRTKKLFYGLGIGFPNEGRPRWESDDYEIAIGASNGHDCTTKYNDPDFEPLTPRGQEKRKIKIVDVRDHAGEILLDPYGKQQLIPDCHEIKINTVYNRDIKLLEIPKKDD
jgi:hypothetical protein